MGKGRGRGGSEYDEELSRSLFRVILPVMICMALTIYLVHSFGSGGCQTNRVSQALELSDGSDTPRTVENDSGLRSKTTTFVFLGVFIGCMVVFTFLLVALYKYHCERFILGWLFLATLMVFSFVGGQYLFKWSRSHCFPLDWVTLVYITINFAVVGMLAIFWKAPRLVNQGYLIVMSSLMAYIFRTLPPWATWVILGVLVLWDLFAVLSKYGPLRVLIEMARERGDPLPALVYDTNPASVGRDASAQPAVIVPPKRTAAERAVAAEERAAAAAAKDARRAAREAAREARASPPPPPPTRRRPGSTGRRRCPMGMTVAASRRWAAAQKAMARPPRTKRMAWRRARGAGWARWAGTSSWASVTMCSTRCWCRRRASLGSSPP